MQRRAYDDDDRRLLAQGRAAQPLRPLGGADGCARRLVWPDGNAWTKVSNTPCPDCPWAPESTPSALLEAPEEHEAEHGGEEHEEARPCVRGVCVVHHEEGGEHGEEAHEEHEPRLWWQPFEREHYYAPTESFQLHVITIAIFALPAAGIAYYLNTQPRLKRMLCVM